MLLSASIAALLAGCNGPGAADHRAVQVAPVAKSPAPVADRPSTAGDAIATVAGIRIDRSALDAQLYDAYGLNLLIDLTEFDLAKAELTKRGLTLEPADVQQEWQLTFKNLFPDQPADQYQRLFDEQFLRQEHLTRTEFELKIVQTNACLRKLARPLMAGKISDADVRTAFGQFYGENRRIADITLPNVRDAFLIQGKLAHGTPFAQMAYENSVDTRTKGTGGEWPPFSAKTPGIPKAIQEAAFTLKLNEVSDTLSDGQHYHLIKLLEIIPPRVVKYEDEKANVREQLEALWLQSAIKALRDQLGQIAVAGLKISDPTLKRKWDQMLDAQRPKTQDRGDTLKQIDKSYEHPATQPATAPAK